MEKGTLMKTERRTLLILMALTLLMTLWSEWGKVGDRYQVVQDVQNSYWMARFRNPELFPQDFYFGERLADIKLWGKIAPIYPRSLGYGLLFYLANPLLDHIWLSKWLVFLLMPLSVAWLYGIGKSLRDSATGFTLGVLFAFFALASYDSIALSSGLQRAFLLPLMIAFIHAMLRQRYAWACTAIVAGALIYWPALPLLLIAYGLAFFRARRMALRAWLIPFIFTLLLVGALFLYEVSIEYRLFLPGQVATSQDPRFQAQGVMSLFVVFPLVGRAGLVMSGTDALNLIVLVLLAFLVYQALGRASLRRVPRVVWDFCAAGVIMYLAALIFLFGFSSTFLYLPSRYTQGTIFIALVVYLGMNWADFVDELPQWVKRIRNKLALLAAACALALGISAVFLRDVIPMQAFAWLGGVILAGMAATAGGSLLGQAWRQAHKGELKSKPSILALAALALASLASGTAFIRVLGVDMINPTPAEREVYQYVRELPLEALIAGDPEIMSGIPLFSERMTLYRKLTPQRREGPLVVEYFTALYHREPGRMADFCRAHGVSHLVVNIDSFSEAYRQRGEFFYEPYNQQIRELTAGGQEIALAAISPLYESGNLRVYACSQLSRY
jgi:hypothetical protein